MKSKEGISAVAECKLTAEYTVTGFRRLRRASLSPLRFWSAVALMLFASTIMILGSWHNPKPDFVGPIIVAGMFAYVLLAPVLRERGVHKRAESDSDVGSTAAWVFSEDSLETTTINGNTVTQWRGFLKARIFSDGLLLYPLNKLAHWVPRAAFSFDEDFTAARQLVCRKIADHRELSSSRLKDWAAGLLQ